MRVEQDEEGRALVGRVVALTLLAVPVVAASMLLPGGGPDGPGSLLGATAGVAVLLAVLVVVSRRWRNELPPAPIGFVVFASAVVACALVDLADGATGGSGLYAVPVVAYATLAGPVALAAGWVTAAAAMVAVTGWSGPARPASGVVVDAGTLAVTAALCWYVTARVRRRRDQAGALGRVAQATARAESLESGLAEVLPVVDEIVPSRAVAVVNVDDHGGVRVLGAAPDLRTTAASLALPADLPAIARHGFADRRDDRWLLPLGHTTAGHVVAVLDLVPRADRRDGALRPLVDQLRLLLGALVERTSFTERLQELSHTDPLTGLANRRALFERLDAELSLADRRALPLAVAMVDLDFFKRFNDEHGHVAGDAVLSGFGEMLGRSVRGSDLPARYGGEEFCLLLPGTTMQGAYELVESLRSRWAWTGPGLTFSSGVAEWDRTETAVALIDRADAALYRAKAAGRARTCVAEHAAGAVSALPVPPVPVPASPVPSLPAPPGPGPSGHLPPPAPAGPVRRQRDRRA